MGSTHYDVLGVTREASDAEIEAAYQGVLLATATADAFGESVPLDGDLRVEEAFHVLHDPHSRAIYDAIISAFPPPAGEPLTEAEAADAAAAASVTAAATAAVAASAAAKAANLIMAGPAVELPNELPAELPIEAPEMSEATVVVVESTPEVIAEPEPELVPTTRATDRSRGIVRAGAVLTLAMTFGTAVAAGYPLGSGPLVGYVGASWLLAAVCGAVALIRIASPGVLSMAAYLAALAVVAGAVSTLSGVAAMSGAACLMVFLATTELAAWQNGPRAEQPTT